MRAKGLLGVVLVWVVLELVMGVFTGEVMKVEAKGGQGRPVYVEGPGWGLRVLGQEKGCWDCVTMRVGEATLFREAWRRGVIGLLAHDFLSGKVWYGVRPGDVLGVWFAGGDYVRFVVVETMAWFRGGELSEAVVYELAYMQAGRLTLQTCLPNDGFWLVFAERVLE